MVVYVTKIMVILAKKKQIYALFFLLQQIDLTLTSLS